MIEMTPSLPAITKPGVPSPSVEPGGGSTVVPAFSAALTDAMGAGGASPDASVTPVTRQKLAGGGKAVPVALDAEPGLPDETPLPGAIGQAKPVAKSEIINQPEFDPDREATPQQEPALAWLLPPAPPPVEPPVETKPALVANTPVVNNVAPMIVPPSDAVLISPAAAAARDMLPVSPADAKPAPGANTPVVNIVAPEIISPTDVALLSQTVPPVAIEQPVLADPSAPSAADTLLAQVPTAPTAPQVQADDTRSEPAPAAASDRAVPHADDASLLPVLRALPEAVHLAKGSREERARTPRPIAFQTATGVGADAVSFVPLRTVEPTEGPIQAGIDLARDHGLRRMIDRIEVLRDAADARDTRIRLIPDSLGPVAISVRQDGDSVRVHFTATEANTRQLITDAQPRLTELAEARGLRIGHATVDGGATGHPQGQAHSQQPQARSAPQPNAFRNRAAANAEADATDHRIA